jgi:hypothetical protein
MTMIPAKIQARWPHGPDSAKLETLGDDIEITAAAATAAIFPHPENESDVTLLTAGQLEALGEAALALAERLKARRGEIAVLAEDSNWPTEE